jgi:predicted metal-binding membrane protein
MFLSRWLDAFFERHKGARRIALLWAMALITYATHQLFADVTAINQPAVAAYGIVTGLLTAVIGFYQWNRARDEDVK